MKKQSDRQKQRILARRKRSNHLWGRCVQLHLQSSPDWFSTAKLNQMWFLTQPGSASRVASPSAFPLPSTHPPCPCLGLTQPLQCADPTHRTEEKQASKLDQFTEVSKKCQNKCKISTRSMWLGTGRGESKAHPQQKPVRWLNHVSWNRKLRV